MYAITMNFSYSTHNIFMKALTSCCMHSGFGVYQSTHNGHLKYGKLKLPRLKKN